MKKQTLLVTLVTILASMLFTNCEDSPNHRLVERGSCGSNLSWELNDTVLIIKGWGDMQNFDMGGVLGHRPSWDEYKDHITTIIIKDRVTSIGHYAFYECSRLSSITIGNNVASIGESAFHGCRSLTSVTIPNSVTTIWNYAFCECINLASISIPNSVTRIGGYAFLWCRSLTHITIPNSVISISYGAFRGCESLTSITIPNSVASIGEGVSSSCSSLIYINVEAGNVTYDSRESCNAIIETASNTLIAGCMKTFIPNSVTSIGEWAFEDCSELKSIIIPDGVTYIEREAFRRCSGLTSIIVEAGNVTYDSRESCNAIIETASNSLILGCMTTIIPNSVTRIKSGAFENCSSLTTITIPNSVISIGDDAFYGCSGLKSITCKAETPPNTSSSFRNVNMTIPLYVPAESVDAYRSANGWNLFTNIIGF